MSRGVIGFRVSPVDVAYAVKLCVTGFFGGAGTPYIWYIFGPVEPQFLVSLAPPSYSAGEL